jgi:hypothetical protein
MVAGLFAALEISEKARAHPPRATPLRAMQPDGEAAAASPELVFSLIFTSVRRNMAAGVRAA